MNKLTETARSNQFRSLLKQRWLPYLLLAALPVALYSLSYQAGKNYAQLSDVPQSSAEAQQQADEFTKHYITRRRHMGLPEMMASIQLKQYYEADPENARLALAKVTGLSHLG